MTLSNLKDLTSQQDATTQGSIDPGMLKSLRVTILENILRGILWVGTLAYLGALFLAYNRDLPLLAIGASGAYLWLLVSSLFRRIPYNVKAVGLLLVLYGFGIVSLLVYGLSGTGRFFLLGVPLLASILYGYRAGIWTLIISTLTLAAVGLGMTSGMLAMPSVELLANSNDPVSWITAGLIALLLGLIVIVSHSGLTSGLEVSITHERELANQVEARQSDLVDQVRSHTADLERRIVQIRTAAEISRSISTLTDTQTLLTQVVELIRARFDLYYAGVFLMDQDGEYAILRAGTGEAGEKMLAAGHKLSTGSQSMIGWTVANRRARIALDVGQEAVRFENPHLPLTRSELALPILTAERVIGALTIQSTRPRAFDQDDITVLQSIADSLGTAIENARLFSEIQTNLEEIQSLERQTIRRAWSDLPYRPADLHYIFETNSSSYRPESGEVVDVPLSIRGEVIGTLKLEIDRKELSPEERSLIEGVAYQAAQALENVRLLEETQRRAERDRVAANVSARIWASTDIDAILRNALHELGRALNASEGEIRLELSPEGINGNGGKAAQAVSTDAEVLL
jgi:GAF domain-containing protein